MKHGFVILGSVLSMCFASIAHAGSTVCAGTSVHYSLSMADMGAAPMPGMHLGFQFLSIGGKLVQKQDYYAQKMPVGKFDLKLNFKSQKPLAHGGTPVAGWSVESATLEVVDPTALQPIATEAVVCSRRWIHNLP